MSHFSYMEKLLDGVGVELKTLGWVGEVRMCKRIMKNQTSDIGDIPFFKIGTFGKEPNAYISRKIFHEYKEKYSYPRIGEVLISASGTIGRTVIFDGREAYFQDSNIVWLENDESKVLNKYLFHFYKIAKWGVSNGGVISRLYNDNIKKTLIPIPCPNDPKKSLEIQAEIVRILDAFTAMTAELTAELNMRKKQYNYYRDQLLSFEEGEVEWKTLEEVAHFANGKGHEKDISEDGKFIVVNSKFISTDGLVAKYSDSQICPLFKDDILLVMSDLPNGKALSKTFIVDEDERYTLNQRIGGITVKDKSEILPKFLHYYLDRTPQLLKHDNGVDQTNLRKGQILEVKVPILPLQKQEHIVSILDKFDKLTKSLSEGLPREIELRQKQYEYYRDLLLSFPAFPAGGPTCPAGGPKSEEVA